MRIRTPFVLTLSFVLGSCSCSDSPTPALPGPVLPDVAVLTSTSIGALGLTPFDVDVQDLVGPGAHAAKYGKLPEIVAVPGPDFVDVVWNGYGGEATRTFLHRIEDPDGTPSVSFAAELPTLGLLLGFARGADGSYYYATGTDDSEITLGDPREGEYRTNVERVYRISNTGTVTFDVDLDLARELADEDCEGIVNPGVASSSRLAVAGDTVAVVHGINTPSDGTVRHQKALTTTLDAMSGAVTATNGTWVSHSFDERYLVDGADLFEVHLGDAYPRAMVLSRIRAGDPGPGFDVVHNKGTLGDNNTYARLGGLAKVEGGAAAGTFLLLYATEREAAVTETVNGPRDLALTRLVAGFADGAEMDAVDDSFGATWTVTSAGAQRTNRAVFLTDFGASGQHAERPRIVAIGSGELLVIYERWTRATGDAFDGTYAMRIDGDGVILAGPTRVSDHHLPRGDDAFAFAGGLAYVTGDAAARALRFHRLAADLTMSETTIP